MTKNAIVKKPVRIVIPFDDEPDPSLFESLRGYEQELQELHCRLVVVDCVHREPKLDLPCIRLENPGNLGFTHAANLGLKQAIEDKADVVLLSPTTVVYPGALREMQRVAYLDSMIGFVSPRSNDAAIGSFPPQQEFHKAPPARAHTIFTELSHHMPVLQYVPMANESCVFIKVEVLKELGFLDETYEKGRDAFHDLVMRANRCGYRAALACHAFIYHHSSISDPANTTSEVRDGALLGSRYPEYMAHVRSYFESAHYRAEVLMAGLLKDERGRYNIVFDCSNFGNYHNGTFEAAKQILTRAAANWEDSFNIHVLVDDEPARFHGLHLIPGITLVAGSTQRVFAIAIRIGQPFQHDAVLRMSRLAIFNVYAMLDPIAWDCLYLHNDELDEAWGAVFSYADAIIYLTDFVADQFQLRFQPRAGIRELTAYPSLNVQDYQSYPETLSSGDYLLVIGNAFAHKNVGPTVEILSREFAEQKIVVLGLEQAGMPNVIAYRSGHLSDQELHALFLNARAVVFPSFYEGFGIPILQGLAYHKPVLARSTEVNHDLFERLGRPDDLILYESTEELILHLKSCPNWKGSMSVPVSKHDWSNAAEEIRHFLCRLSDEVLYTDVLIPRLNYMSLLDRISETKRRDQGVAATLAQRDARIGELEANVADLQGALRDRDLRINGLLSSFSWIITAPIRSVGSLWIRLFSNKVRDRPV